MAKSYRIQATLSTKNNQASLLLLMRDADLRTIPNHIAFILILACSSKAIYKFMLIWTPFIYCVYLGSASKAAFLILQ
jgi:hypothetical protein